MENCGASRGFGYIYIDELESLHTWELTYRFKAFARLTRLRPFF